MRARLVLFILFFSLLLSGCQDRHSSGQSFVWQPSAQDDYHASFITDKESIEKVISSSAKSVTKDRVYGAVVNHHLLAISVMGDLFKVLEGQKYQTIVLIGPDHFNIAKNKVAVSLKGFKTPYGFLEPDLVLAENLLKAEYVSVDEDVFSLEHSIGAPVGFVKKNWPEAKFLPVVVSFKTDEKTAMDLGLRLAQYLPEDSLVIASCDFAHHVDRETAVLYDAESLIALESGDINMIKKAHVDSVQSLVVLESYLSQRQMREFSLVSNTNAADILGRPDYDDVTSYIVGYFIKE